MKLYVFSSNKCQPCVVLKENLKKNNIPFVEMNFDNMKDTDRNWSTKFKIMSLPTLLFIQDEKVIERMSGTVPIEIIKKYLR